MKIGISVNVGLNKVASTVYSAPALVGCEEDAKRMRHIAELSGFDMAKSTLLLGDAAKFDAVKNAVLQAADVLQPGDLFFFSFAGHGTFKVVNNAPEEFDNHDESIVLSDHFMIDNFWRKKLWPKFKAGVRIIAIADCCHSETIVSAAVNNSILPAEVETVATAANVYAGAGAWSSGFEAPVRGEKIPTGKEQFQAPRFRMITEAEREKEIDKFPEFYTAQSAAPPQEIVATRLFLSACKDDQKAADGDPNGAFTAALLKVWNNGNFAGDYTSLMTSISAEMPNLINQTPKFTKIGAPDFSSEKPFTI